MISENKEVFGQYSMKIVMSTSEARTEEMPFHKEMPSLSPKHSIENICRDIYPKKLAKLFREETI